MAMYYCHHCDNMLDNDYHPGEEDPRNELELICPECLLEWQERAEEDLHDEDYRKPKIPFDKTQHFFKMYKTQEQDQ
jgi:uncharacterized Zn ribbon protein